MVPSSVHELRAVVSLLDYLMDRVFLSIKAVRRRMIFCNSVYSDVASRDLVDVVFCSLLDKPKSTSDH